MKSEVTPAADDLIFLLFKSVYTREGEVVFLNSYCCFVGCETGYVEGGGACPWSRLQPREMRGEVSWNSIDT
jgi:hypothetical protein